MRIASFNINNINRRLPNLLAWLRETEPNVVSLQELKSNGCGISRESNPGRRI
jgi:exodeoxyribonuclease III